MDVALTTQSMFRHGLDLFGRKQVVSRTAGGEVVRHTFVQVGERVNRLASALRELGIRQGDRVATFAWNHHRHLEAYFAVPNMGAVLHTVNIRLFPEQLAYIINHAEDRVLLIDTDLLPLIEAVTPKLTTVKHFVVLAHDVPNSQLPNLQSYEQLLASANPEFAWPELDEKLPAAMCYTSATTGNPKGVIYTHRSTYLHALATGLADGLALGERDVVLPFVPMFHVNAWGLPYGGFWFGSKLVFPGPRPDAKAVLDLMQSEKVTLAAGVPTIWIAALPLLEAGGYQLDSVRAVLCGGSAIPPALMKRYAAMGLPFLHAYGMTETSPLATVARTSSWMDNWPQERQLAIRTKQGRPFPGIDFRVVNDDGQDVPRDGKSFGQLLMRGPWVASEYYRDSRSAETFKDGWLHSGDIVTCDEDGYINIVDRAKDVIKSGGEWISTVDLENAIMAIEGVAEAAVIGVTHPRWQERPLACVVCKPGINLTKEHILAPLRGQFAKWWIPNDVVFVEEIPKTSVGKFQKRDLRDRFKDYQLTDKES
ncbi:MAG TPA: long-chain fatty acid--CoA ligase [Chloroflexota bacterium]|nr:long-chain fatty acid--CoA ligase [Chloroflexota bacterium]